MGKSYKFLFRLGFIIPVIVSMFTFLRSACKFRDYYALLLLMHIRMCTRAHVYVLE